MANTLTNLIPTIYESLDVISREFVGMIPSVTIDAASARAAVGQTIRSPVAPANSAADITPATTPPDTGDQTWTSQSYGITKARAVPVRFTGEEQLGLNAGGPGYQMMLRDAFSQAMRTLTNEIEVDLAALSVAASRAVGTAGTTPFGTAGDFTDASLARQILIDNGAPQSELKLVLNTAAGANLRGKQPQYQMIGQTTMLTQGTIIDINGFQIRESAQISAHTKGTGASATTDNAGYAVGVQTLTLASAGTGTLLAGDVVTFAGDANKYVVTTGDTDVSNGGTLVLGAPGIRIAMSAATKAITVGNSYTPNLAFARSAIVLVARAPAAPEGGDMADDVMMVTDPLSGLTFEVRMYREYRRVRYEIGMAWGVKAMKPEHIAILMG